MNLALLSIGLLLSFSSHAQSYRPESFRLKQSRYELTVQRHAQTQTLKIKGTVIIASGEKLQTLLSAVDRLEPGRDTKVVLDMFGGDLAVVNKVYQKIKAKCHDRGHSSCVITTEVEMFRYCASACIPLFMVGDVRRAAERSNWGFHQAALVEGFIMIPFMAEFELRRKGVNSQWLKHNKAMFNTLKISWRNPQELNGSGIVTHIVTHPLK